MAFSAMISFSSYAKVRRDRGSAPAGSGIRAWPGPCPQRGREDVVQVLLAAPVPLHRIEAQLGGRDIVLAVCAPDASYTDRSMASGEDWISSVQWNKCR